MKFAIQYQRAAQALLIIGPIVSLAVSPATNYDPINLIKLLFATPVAIFVLALLASTYKFSVSRLNKPFWITSFGFLLAMISTLLFSGAPVDQQFWGMFGRNTGFLTYFTLLIFLVSCALIQSVDFYHKIVSSLVITAIPMTLYCLIQVAHMDPVGWSLYAPFGTLGNINFSSAFFGLTSIACTSLLFEKSISKFVRISMALMVLTDLIIVYTTGSIQGLLVFLAGIGLVIYIYIRKTNALKKLSIPYVLLALGSISLTVIGLANKGPLARYIFSDTVVFRGDYWHAGWVMTTKHPFFGVGMDSYGDWYRAYRGLISTTRTTSDRITNTAHNIFLDISSNGGFPLIAAYLALTLITLISAIRVIKRGEKFNPYFVALFGTWFGYQIQATISINQVGVGIWGWLFSGSIIGYEYATRSNSLGSPNSSGFKTKKKGATLSAGSGVIAFFGLVVGFVLAFIPFNADMKYKSATQTREIAKIMDSVKLLGSTAFHMEMALDSAIKGNLQAQVLEIDNSLINKNERSFFGWKVRAVLSASTPEDRAKAAEVLRELDPYNPDILKP